MSQVSDQIAREAGIITVLPKDTKTLEVSGRSVIIPGRRESLLKTVDYFEAEIGRLAKMARDFRAEIINLSVE